MTGFRIAPAVAHAFPDTLIAVVTAVGLRGAGPWPLTAAALDELEGRLADGAWQPADESDPRIEAWHAAYRAFGTNPRRIRTSVDALGRRMAKKGTLPRINPAVDSYNSVSVRHGLPAGAFDLDHVSGDVEIRHADGGETFTPLGEPGTVEHPKAGEVVYTDAEDVLTRHWNHREPTAPASPRTPRTSRSSWRPSPPPATATCSRPRPRTCGLCSGRTARRPPCTTSARSTPRRPSDRPRTCRSQASVAWTRRFLARGLPYSSWSELGVDVHVAHVELDWKAAITLADRPGVLMNTARIGGRSFTLDFAFTCDGRVTADGCIVYVAVATDGSGSTLLPPRLVEALGEVSPVRTARTPS